MSCVIMYSKGKFRFRYGGVKFEVDATEDTLRLFNVLSSFLILDKAREKQIVGVEWQALRNEVERALRMK